MDEEELVDYEADEEDDEDDHQNSALTNPPHVTTTQTNTDTSTTAPIPQRDHNDDTGHRDRKTATPKTDDGDEQRTKDKSTRTVVEDGDGTPSSVGKRAATDMPSREARGYYEGDGRKKRPRITGARGAEPKVAGKSDAKATMIRAGNASSGVYVPPFRRRQLEQQQQQQLEQQQGGESSTPNNNAQAQKSNLQQREAQRIAWEKLKKTINGTVNRLNATTIKPLIHTLLQSANLIRGKGLLARSLLRAATTSPTFSHIYASLISVINTKLPEIGELILTRAIIAFRKSYARRDRGAAVAMSHFIGNLFNQGLCHELLCLQILTVLLEGEPTDDSVEVAAGFTEVVGVALLESSPAGVHAIMERFRGLLHDGTIGRRVQYKVEELMKKRRKGFKMCPAVLEELDLVEREEQIMFEIGLDDQGLKREEALDVFQFDDKWEENENTWTEIQKEILGDDDDDTSSNDDDDDDNDDDDDDGENSTDDESQDDSGTNDDDSDDGNGNDDGQLSNQHLVSMNKLVTVIHDMSEKDLIHLRRTIYLTIMSSATFEECAHKLNKVDIPPGKEVELINMIIECCSQERTFLRYYGLISARFCLMHRRWREAFQASFTVQYETIHRLGTNKLRNVAKLFAHLLHTDALPWSCLSSIHLNEDETTSSSRIFLKILVQEMAGAMGIATLVTRFETDDPGAQLWYAELFPKDKPRSTRYAINFFTSIGLGPLTDGLREHLKNAPKLIKLQAERDAERALALKNEADDGSSVGTSVSSSSTSTMESSSVSSSSTDGSSSSYDSYDSSSGSSGSYTSYSSDESSLSYRRKKGGGGGTKHRTKGGSGKRRRSRSNSSSSRSSYHDRKSRRGGRSSRKDRSVSRSPSRSPSRSRSKAKSTHDSVPTEIRGGSQERRETQRTKSKSDGGGNRTEHRKERNGQAEKKKRSRSYSSRSSSTSSK